MGQSKNNLLSLSGSREYVGYQYYVRIKRLGFTGKETVCYIALTIMDWLRSKVASPNGVPEELRGMSAEEYVKKRSCELPSFVYESGFSVKTAYLESDGKWALQLKEPDINAEAQDRQAVVGRFFITDIGVADAGDDIAELGCKVTVSDPENCEEELAYAFRPAFIKALFLNNDVTFLDTHSNCRLITSTKELNSVVNNADSRLPSVIFTYLNEQRHRETNTDRVKDAYSVINYAKLDVLLREDKHDSTLIYDTDEIVSHFLGFANGYILDDSDELLRKLKEKTGLRLDGGEIIVAEPKAFGGAKRVYKCANYNSNKEKRAIVSELKHYVESFSKNKPYSFGDVRFYSAILPDLQKAETERILKSVYSTNEKCDRLADILGQMRSENEALNKRIESLTLQLSEEGRKAALGYEKELETLKAENSSLASELGKLRLLNQHYSDMISASNNGAITLVGADKGEFFVKEQYDLVVSVLRSALNSYTAENTRAYELLSEIIEKNPLNGEGMETLEELKQILSGHKNLTESDFSNLKSLGFEVSMGGNGHYRLCYKDDPKYVFTMPATSSDVRNGKNMYGEICRKISVYK